MYDAILEIESSCFHDDDDGDDDEKNGGVSNEGTNGLGFRAELLQIALQQVRFVMRFWVDRLLQASMEVTLKSLLSIL